MFKFLEITSVSVLGACEGARERKECWRSILMMPLREHCLKGIKNLFEQAPGLPEINLGNVSGCKEKTLKKVAKEEQKQRNTGPKSTAKLYRTSVAEAQPPTLGRQFLRLFQE